MSDIDHSQKGMGSAGDDCHTDTVLHLWKALIGDTIEVHAIAFIDQPFLYFFFADFLGGTFAPARRASDKPIAIACLRLFTFFPERPLLSLPCFFSCIARATLLDAPALYFLAIKKPRLLLSPCNLLKRFVAAIRVCIVAL